MRQAVTEALSKVQVVPIADTQILQFKYVSSSREESYNMIYGLTEELMKKRVIKMRSNL